MHLRPLIWPLFTLVMGIALGGSLFWGVFGPVATDKNFGRLAPSVQEAQLHRTKEENDEALVRYTLWLAVLTGGLVLVSAGQGFFLLRADKTARMTAEASQAQTHNFSKLERPYLYISNPKGLELEAHTPDPYHYVTYQVANYGKTPATIKEFFAAISVGKVPGDLGVPQRWHPLRHLPIMIPNETRSDLWLAVPESIAIGEFADEDTPPMPVPELAGDEEFYVHILIKYRGPFTSDHETSGCWRWEGTSLVSFDDDRFTYMR